MFTGFDCLCKKVNHIFKKLKTLLLLVDNNNGATDKPWITPGEIKVMYSAYWKWNN